MKQFLRFTALMTLAAFLGLSAAETSHRHQANQRADNCPVCQIAHRTPAITSTVASIGPHWVSTPIRPIAALQAYVQFVLVSHGLSPPVL